ncbi:hypothetical protein PENTCL1PPCAC_25194, partial [Pristionchus entomophagus]
LKCPECEYRSRHVGTFISHLKNWHFTTVRLANLALLCDCGNEYYAYSHFLTCPFANCVLIRKSDGPIRRYNRKRHPKAIYRIHRDVTKLLYYEQCGHRLQNIYICFQLPPLYQVCNLLLLASFVAYGW